MHMITLLFDNKTLTLIIFSFFCFVDVRKELLIINLNENIRSIA